MTGISEPADRAADYIERNGHCNTGVTSDGNNACIIHAFSCTRLNGLSAWSECRDAIADMIGLDSWTHIVDWNDKPERKAEEVIQVLRDVATKHRDDAMTVEVEK